MRTLVSLTVYVVHCPLPSHALYPGLQIHVLEVAEKTPFVHGGDVHTPRTHVYSDGHATPHKPQCWIEDTESSSTTTAHRQLP